MKFIICFIIAISCTGLQEKGPFIAEKLTGKVIKIVDGDTFDLLTKEKSTQRIRMNGIDCPERKQDHYQVARDALAGYIFGKEVELLVSGRDRNKRLIATAFYNGQNINLAMIENGYAWHYKQYSSDKTFAEAEKKARALKRGLWKMPGAVAPWEFRKKKRKEQA